MYTEADMQTLARALGRNVREQRLLAGISQDALAFACQMDRSYIGRIERGEVNLTIEKLYRIAHQLNCPPQQLLPSLIPSS